MSALSRISSTIIKALALSVVILPFALSGMATKASAQSISSDIAKSLPAQIPEILTGGTWTNGNIGGVYRAVVVMSDAKKKNTKLASIASSQPERKAEVFIQWLSNGDGRTPSKIVKTVSIKEFNEKDLRHAFLAMDTLKDNEMTLLVTSYDDRKDKDISVSVKATTPGKYMPASK